MISPSTPPTQHLSTLIRVPVFQEYLEQDTPYLLIDDARSFLQEHPYMFWEFQAFIKGRAIKPYPHTAIGRNDVHSVLFVDIQTRNATHYAKLHAFQRRDLYFSLATISELTVFIHPKFKDSWFDISEAQRTYTALISDLKPLPKPLPISTLTVYNTTGHVNTKDPLIHPRVVYLPSSLLHLLS